ncbi:MAG: CPBP family intramembrane metalloprotease [Muribaculaceae bacterium]|nr:CPBP family intramembrane metalloprotease [Muribaculaceae bacterium]
MKIILSRVDDAKKYSKKWVIGYALLFWLTTRILSVLLVVGCTMIYEHLGYDKEMFPTFGGVPQGVNTIGRLLFSIAKVAIIVPLLGELVFRLGLSFKKWQVSLGLASIPVYIAWSYTHPESLGGAVVYAIIAIAVYFTVDRCITQKYLDNLKSKWLVAAMWITSLAFGLVHLHAFSFLTWGLLPYALCMVSSTFFMGCACAYLRVNIGFWWGFGMHVFSNIPGLFTIILMSLH